MRRSFLKLSLFAGLTILLGCHSGSGSGNGPGFVGKPFIMNGKAVQGVWMSKDDAVELRATGKIKSICDEVQKDPNSHISNIRNIESSGAVYIYVENLPAYPSLKMGDLNANGVLTLTDNFAKQMGVSTMLVNFVDDDTINFSLGGVGMEYVRSSHAEAAQYFTFQESCRP